ncbi:MAG TPA: T9SS type A sorting domain-containing protein [Saprospiraceae bacterium]
MFNRKLLLISLLTVMSWLGAMAQNNVIVHGTVSNEDGSPANNVNIVVSVFFADSTAAQYSEDTDAAGYYSVDIATPDQNYLGWVQVSMVDCWGTTQSLFFTIMNGNEVFLADFAYCEWIQPDSCAMFIVEEWLTGDSILLTAWIPPGTTADFEWNTGETTQTIMPVASGSYCVTATFGSGCVLTDCTDVWIDSTSCFTYIVSTNNSDGTFNLEAVVGFGQAPYTYLWSNGEQFQLIDSVPAGTYCVTLTDAVGCSYTACAIVENINFCETWIYEQPGGALFAEGFGAYPLEFVWSTGDTGQVLYVNAAGLYCVTMTDAEGCVSSSCYEYYYPVDSCYVYVNAFVTDSNQFSLTAIPYTTASSWAFLWSTGETSETIYPTDPTQSYCVTMTDSEGCQSVGCYDVGNWCYAWINLQYIDTTTAILDIYTNPIFSVPGFDPTYLWSTGDTTQTLTVNESGTYCATVTIGTECITETCVYVDFDSLSNDCSVWVIQYPDSSGQWYAEAYSWGWGLFSYNWSNGDTNSVTLIENPAEQTCVTVTSTFGCESVACTDTFFLPCEAVISVNYISNSEAILTATVWNDPTQNATFTWNTGETGPVITVTEEGTYCVTTMAGGCVKTTCIDVYFWNVDPCGVWISEDHYQGSGILYIANAWGVGPFQYLWSNGATSDSVFVDFGIHDLCVTITDANGCVSSGCNYKADSCYVQLYYTDVPVPSIQIYSSDPIALVYWSTGDTLPWLEITEPGTYCATVTTIFGCENTACITVDTLIPSEGLNVISGYVFGDTLASLVGHVYAYLLNPNTGNDYDLIDSAQIGQYGFYSFPDLPDGVYLLKAQLAEGSPNDADYLPTYHLNSTTWEEATPHALPNWLPVTTDIYLKRTTGLNGSGVIGGLVTDPQHLFAGEDLESRGLNGLGHVEVILKDAQGEPLQYVWTLPDGSFRFPGLPWGTYRISFDIPGLTSPDIWVTISAETPERLNITLIVNGTVAVEEPVREEIKLYPNPASHEVNIPLTGSHAVVDVQVMDMQGKLVYAGSVKNTNSVITVDVASFAPGLYHINLSSAQGLFYGRFVKQD